MNKENYNRIKAELQSLNFNYVEPQKSGMIEVDVKDKIKILEIMEDEVELLLTRNITLDKTLDCLTVDFKVNILTNKRVTKDELVADLKKGIPILSVAYAKITTIIAEVTNASPMNAFITSPSYEKDLTIM